ncbi:MAG: AAA family ATPase, partial [Gammaproteobacteria bacterium]|nr:AAA family ATPase [Gammaproteobacteria bacterium]
MRLDRLEVSGFKSFPDRADVAFDAGVTAIVGPNGCGKSNLVDAITWVLGEQSARSLRGERMEDVIFSGSDARKATGAAEVRLRLSGVPSESARRAASRRDGLEGPEAAAEAPAAPQQIDLPAIESRQVEIARRLYRSGESEYLIDGEGCRLRDVQDLLMDAGVGIKAYAVIEQGKIGQILSAKPTERRQLIEEAAGVTKYKSRRRAAELKLEAAQQNLTRVDDIVFEIEKQRAALKRQAAKARRYKRLREELRRWEKVLFARRYRALSQQIEAAHARVSEARAREAAAADRVTMGERHVASARAALAQADGRLQETRERLNARERENDRRAQQLAFDRQQIETLLAAGIEVAAEIAALEARREPARLEIEARRGAAMQAGADRQDAAQALAAAQETARERQQALEALEGDVEDARARLSASQNTIVTLQYAIERAQDGRSRLADALQRLDAEAADARIESERLRAEHEEAVAQLASARAAIDGARAARAACESALLAARA